MAESNIMGLFANPEDIRQKQRERLLNEGRQSAGMLMQGGGSGLAQAIKGYGANVAQYMPLQADRMKRGLMGAAAEVAGLQGNEEGRRAIQLAAMSPQEQEAAQARQIVANTDASNIYSVKQAIEKFRAVGNDKGVAAMTAKLEQLQERNLSRAADARDEQFRNKQFAQTKAYQDASLEHQAKTLGLSERKWKEGKEARTVALETAQNTLNQARSLQDGLTTIAGDPAALEGLGFDTDLVRTIADSENKTGWHPMIKARMEMLAGKDGTETANGGGGVTGEQFGLLNAEVEKLNNLEKGTPAWNRQNARVVQMAQQFDANQTKVIEARSKINAEEAKGASTQNMKIDEAVRFINANGITTTGLSADVQDAAAKIFGTQGPEQYVRTTIQGIINSSIIDNLPPGVASDKDVELVLKGAPPANASPEVLKRYLEGVRKINEYKLKEQARYSEYVSDARNQINPHGYDAYKYKTLQDERKQWLMDNGFEAAAQNPDNLTGSGFFKIASGVTDDASALDEQRQKLQERLDKLRGK